MRMTKPERLARCLSGHFEHIAVPALFMYNHGVTLRSTRANIGLQITLE